MLLKRKQNAFSLVELMMLLLISSLITAALVPVVTKKHFRLPSATEHGAYMCYYKDGNLHETKWMGRANKKMVFDRDTDSCVFVPPSKAAYFQISAIGGGGGGGDAGYTDDRLVTGLGDEITLSPFGITQARLDELKIDAADFRTYAGSLRAYAISNGSGAGGDIVNGSSLVEGGAGGSGVICGGTTAVSGDLNLTYEYESNISTFTPSKGDSISSCTENFGQAYQGYADCISGQATSCSNPTYSYFGIKQDDSDLGSAKALSAVEGGGGAYCSVSGDVTTMFAFTTPVADGTCGSGTAFLALGSEVDCDNYVDDDYLLCEALENNCTGTTYTSCNGDDLCNAITSCEAYGYYLKHYDGSMERNGLYTYKYEYDSNYLQYGNPGEPGEFKTVIVRSLDDVDVSIKIGRGGSAAVLSLGGDGSQGSSTSFGSIISAEGGTGGTGGNMEAASVLPGYIAANDVGDYYYRTSGQQDGAYPTVIGTASSIKNFVFSTDNDSEAIQNFTKLGKGGKGGGVEHKCWAGLRTVVFDGVELPTDESDSTVGCRNDNNWENVAAGSGANGALLIKW